MKLVFRTLGAGSEEQGKAFLRDWAVESRYIEIAKEITEVYGIEVNRQNVRYWVKIANTNKALTDRDMPVTNLTYKPVPSLEDAEVDVTDGSGVILVMGDDHNPYGHPDKMEFLRGVKERFHPDTVVHLGDEVDHHAMSMHDSDPNLDSAGPELYKARRALKELAELFPTMLLCNSNHGSMAYRRALKHGIPTEYIKDYLDVLFPDGDKPDWKWADEWELETQAGPVLFRHQFSGKESTSACHEGRNTIGGHWHSKLNVEYRQSRGRLYFGASCGCLADPKSLAFRYSVNMMNRPILGVILICAGVPLVLPMPLDEKGRLKREDM